MATGDRALVQCIGGAVLCRPGDSHVPVPGSTARGRLLARRVQLVTALLRMLPLTARRCRPRLRPGTRRGWNSGQAPQKRVVLPLRWRGCIGLRLQEETRG